MIKILRQGWALLLGVVTLVYLETSHLLNWLIHQQAPLVLGGLGVLSVLVLLLARRVASQTDHLAEQLGEPLGTLVLTGSVIVSSSRWSPARCSAVKVTQLWPGIRCSPC